MNLLAVGSAMMLIVELLSRAGAAVQIERVHFLDGESTALRGAEISGYDAVKYIVTAGAGQTIVVKLMPGSEACALRVWTPGADEPDFADAMQGHEYVARHARPGLYTAQVFLTRGGARRGETCPYRISIELTGKADVLEKAKGRRGM